MRKKIEIIKNKMRKMKSWEKRKSIKPYANNKK